MRFLQSTIGGLGTGSVYVLLGLGFVIIYRSSSVVSFAQPALLAFGTWWAIYFSSVLGINFFLAMAVALVITAIMGLVIERVAIRPMIGEPVFAIAILTLGIDIVLRVISNNLLGSDIRSIPDPWGLKNIHVGGLVIQQRHIAMVIATALIVTLLFVFLRSTRIGLAMRAASLDQEAALAQGISVGTVFALSWAIAGALAAVAGVFVGSGSGVDQQTSFVALRALPAVVLGGLDSIEGAVIGGLLIGLAEGWTATYQTGQAEFLGANFSQVVPYLVMLVVLLVRPFGLFGTKEIERV